MRFAILSDVHANLEALEAVLQDVDIRRIKDVFLLGDAVGYGPKFPITRIRFESQEL